MFIVECKEMKSGQKSDRERDEVFPKTNVQGNSASWRI